MKRQRPRQHQTSLTTAVIAIGSMMVGAPMTGALSPPSAVPDPATFDRVTPDIVAHGAPEPWRHAAASQPPDNSGWPQLTGRNVRACSSWNVDVIARGYYLNDQRIQWSGVEATFGAEGVLAPEIRHRCGRWELACAGEFFFTQPFDRNILADTSERVSYLDNYRVETFKLSQLNLTVARDDFSFVIGKMTTPFGRYYTPLFTNAWLDAPFIRTEAIIWRETGLLMRYKPGCFVADVALTNGGEDRDANSSKALVSRLGIEREAWATGVSVKVHDGIGSEGQKIFKNHFGMDAMLRLGPWTVFGEVIYDEYGFRRPGFDPENITWGRSVYFRDLNRRMHLPLTGIGYYVGADYHMHQLLVSLNYGEFYPQELGDPRHDVTHRRGIVKVDWDFAPHLSLYSATMIENGGYIAQDGRERNGLVVLVGFQYDL